MPHWCRARCGCSSKCAFKRACHRCGVDKPLAPGAKGEGKAKRGVSQQAAASKGAGTAAEAMKERRNAWSPHGAPPARPTLGDFVAAERAKLEGVAAASPIEVAVTVGDPASEL